MMTSQAQQLTGAWLMGQVGLLYRLLTGSAGEGTRSALINTVSSARGEVPPIDSDPPAKQKPFETVPCQFRFAYHWAEAAVLMRSLRVPRALVKAPNHSHRLEIPKRPLQARGQRTDRNVCPTKNAIAKAGLP